MSKIGELRRSMSEWAANDVNGEGMTKSRSTLSRTKKYEKEF